VNFVPLCEDTLLVAAKRSEAALGTSRSSWFQQPVMGSQLSGAGRTGHAMNWAPDPQSIFRFFGFIL
jgi:hypothetical protein